MKKVLHVVESLGVGGAEKLLVDTVNALGSEFESIVVYLNGPETLAKELGNIKLVCLNYSGKISLPAAIYNLRKVILNNKIDLVHAHLLWPSIIARVACPSHVRLIFSVHSILSEDAFKPNPKSRILEMLTYKSRHEIIFVSEVARKDYASFIGIKGKSYILYNFIANRFFESESVVKEFTDRKIKLVAVGNLKEAKNYPYLLKVMGLLKGKNITLDIYGEGHLRENLQNLIHGEGLTNVELKGLAFDIPKTLGEYDIFVLSSEHEGFGLAAIEAMASGLPCFLSELPVFREVTNGNAIFFDLNSPTDLVSKLTQALQIPTILQELSKNGFSHAKLFNRENYIKQLTEIYNNEAI